MGGLMQLLAYGAQDIYLTGMRPVMPTMGPIIFDNYDDSYIDSDDEISQCDNNEVRDDINLYDDLDEEITDMYNDLDDFTKRLNLFVSNYGNLQSLAI